LSDSIITTVAPTERFHIALAPAEKRRWTERASAAGLPTPEYVRRAVDAYEDEQRLTPVQIAELQRLVGELNTTHEKMSYSVDSAVANVASWGSPAWEAERRREVDALLATKPFHLDPAILDFSDRG